MNEELKLDQLTYTFDLLVLSTLDHLFFMLRIFIHVTKQATLINEEVNFTGAFHFSNCSLDKIDSHSKK